MFLTLIVVASQLPLLYLSTRGFGRTPFPTLAILYIMLSQMLYGLVHDGIIDNDFLPTYYRGGLYQNFESTQMFYLFISITMFTATMVFRYLTRAKSSSIGIYIDYSSLIPLSVSTAILLVLLGQLMLLSISINWDIVISNREYLLMESPDAVVGESAILQGLFASIEFSGLVSAIFAALTYNAGQRRLLIGFTTITICYFIYFLAAHSRVAAVYPVGFAVILWMIDSNRYWKSTAIMFCVAIVSILSALDGRGSSEQGLSSLSNLITHGIGEAGGFDVFGLLNNICEGIFVFGESVQINLRPGYIYQILSFSPLPSFIDGFSSIRDAQEVRVHEYVPMPGFAELWLFGMPFNMIVIAVFIVGIYLTERLRLLSNNVYMICNILLFLSFYMMNAYPIRNSLKTIWILYLFYALTSLAISILRRSRKYENVRRHVNKVVK